jgi:SAM-dependent MidA family methyltransferase
VSLREKIEEEIRARGPIPFSRYMDLCLYDPEFGYYAKNAEQFGKAGDFYTSSDVHAVFGRLLARQFEEMWRALDSPAQFEILELGPGRGLFAQDVLDWSEKKFPQFFSTLRYSLVEASPALRKRMQETLRRQVSLGKTSLLEPQEVAPRQTNTAQGVSSGSHGVERASQGRQKTPPFHLPRALPPDIPVIVFANEFFDALPVEVLSAGGELRVDTRDGRFVETWVPASAEALELLDRYGLHPEPGERVEAPLLAQKYISQAAARIKRGFLIVIDYGYTRSEQLAGRHRGTVTAYRQHSVSANPYQAPGEQDITAHVNFTALAAEAERQGMTVHPLLTQSQFLMGIGERNQFADAFEDCRLAQERAKVALQLKHLVTPAGMGENFHVLVASRGMDSPVAASLSGLTFGKR